MTLIRKLKHSIIRSRDNSTTVYADSENGNDSNTGKQSDNAVKTLKKASELLTGDNQTISIANGSSFSITDIADCSALIGTTVKSHKPPTGNETPPTFHQSSFIGVETIQI